MVFEQIYSSKWIEQKSRYAFLMGLSYSIIGIFSAMLIFTVPPCSTPWGLQPICFRRFLPSHGSADGPPMSLRNNLPWPPRNRHFTDRAQNMSVSTADRTSAFLLTLMTDRQEGKPYEILAVYCLQIYPPG